MLYEAVLLEHLTDAVVASDRDYILTAWNKAAESLYGWKAEEVIGKTGLDILQTEFPDGDKSGVLASLAENGYYFGEASQLRKDGTRIPVEVKSIVLHDQAGRITGYLSLNRDISERNRSRENLIDGLARIEVQRRLLEQREQERLQIARDLHDGPIQELLAVSLELKELLTDDIPNEISEKLSVIDQAIKAQIIELRNYAGELRPPILANFGLGKAIRAHVETYQARHPEIKIRFDEQQVGGLLPDDTRVALYRIYQESLANIAKHAEASEINIRFVKTEDHATLEIADNGRGFHVPSNWLNLARHGHLGLVGIQERAEALGGSVSLISRPGEGSTIRVTVPLLKTDLPAADSLDRDEIPMQL
jgi:PAS domain S-box-containing protein